MTTRKALFNAIRPFDPMRFRRSETVGLVNQLADHLGLPPDGAAEPAESESGAARPPGALKDAAAFYESLRGSLGQLKQEQVDGLEAVLTAMGAAGWPIAWAAYGLATAWHETAHTMQPVAEAYWIRNAEEWRKKNLRYYPWYGRGYVQLTWEENYRWADRELGLNGALLRDRDLAMKPEHAAAIMVKGMEQGAFAKTHSLRRHLPEAGLATREQFREARRIINGTDKADHIAGLALSFQKALEAGGWA